jgi:thioesterase domain-containing protein
MGENVLSLRFLVTYLGEDHPLFGLQGIDYGSGSGQVKTIQEVAREYAQLIRQIQPGGPLTIVGYSFGGHLALEIARALMQESEIKPMVILIDTYPPVPLRNTTIQNRLRIHLDNLRLAVSSRKAGAYLQGRLQRIFLNLVRSRSSFTAKRVPSTVQFSATPDQIALALHKPAPYPGNVILFKASQRAWYVDWDPMEPWKDFISGKLEIQMVTGKHEDLLRVPQVIDLAARLRLLIP